MSKLQALTASLIAVVPGALLFAVAFVFCWLPYSEKMPGLMQGVVLGAAALGASPILLAGYIAVFTGGGKSPAAKAAKNQDAANPAAVGADEDRADAEGLDADEALEDDDELVAGDDAFDDEEAVAFDDADDVVDDSVDFDDEEVFVDDEEEA